mmetsp:Transcript_11315/g.9704  ORF Transcript_11315/g.9704 Transcript_11315/m.9704 type:complete len:89 (-) Transcript_11315:177-443(-)
MNQIFKPFEHEEVMQLENQSLYAAILVILLGIMYEEKINDTLHQSNVVIMIIIMFVTIGLIVVFVLKSAVFFFNVYKGRISSSLRQLR